MDLQDLIRQLKIQAAAKSLPVYSESRLFDFSVSTGPFQSFSSPSPDDTL